MGRSIRNVRNHGRSRRLHLVRRQAAALARSRKTHVLTHALHYGSAVFEGERIYDGRVFRLAAHSARLINSARLLDYELPWTREQIDEATRAVVKANNLQSGYVRPIAWRGSEVMGVSAIGTTVHLAIAPWAQEGRLSVQVKPGGINVTMAKYRRPVARRGARRTPRWPASTSSAASRRIAR